MKSSPKGVVIVGAGLAGVECAFTMREYGDTRPITIVGREPSMPYDRPPLSKSYLKGVLPLEHLWLRSAAQYADSGIDLRLGVSVIDIDRERRLVRLDVGGYLPYEQLVMATGGEPRTLPVPGSNLDGVKVLKTLQDADDFSNWLVKLPDVVVIGGGYIGLEFAATARVAGCNVTVIEQQARLLSRSAAPVIAEYIKGVHEKHGVTVLTNTEVAQIQGASCVKAVVLSNGKKINADLVLVGIGNRACDDLALHAGLTVAETGGILVAKCGRTSDPNVYAAGDCASRPRTGLPQSMRLESVQSAVEQSKHVAAAITGHDAPADEVPWFWSDQFDIKLQMAGLPLPGDSEILRGDPASGRFSVIYQNPHSLTAIQCVNASGDFISAKRAIAQQRHIAIDDLRNVSVPMREICKKTVAATR